MSSVSFTFDLEDHRSGLDPRWRFVDATYRVLERLAAIHVSGTFFVVGTVAERHPTLVRDVAAARHEIAFHGFDHTPLDEDDPSNFLRQTIRSKRFIEDLVGREVVGYRAPIFSLVRATTWVADALASLGFTYSASVIPAANPRYGFGGAPRHPFRWSSGVLELPAATTRVAGLTLPFLGGVYFRYLPTSLVLERIRRIGTAGLWTYLHPYDCDAEEGWTRVERTTLVESAILSCNRHQTLNKIERLLTACGGAPIGARVAAGEFAAAPTIMASPLD